MQDYIHKSFFLCSFVKKMLKLGQYNTLKILRETSVGWFLGDGEEEVLLPTKYGAGDMAIDSDIEVFVYKDNENRLISTTLRPLIILHEIGHLDIRSVNDDGAYADIGIAKDLFIPFKEQHQKMEVGKQYLIMMLYDIETDRLFGTGRLLHYLSNRNLTIEEGEEVEVMVAHRTDLGRQVYINNIHIGLIFDSDMHAPLRYGDKRTAYVHHIREDKKVDIRLEPTGFRKAIDKHEQIILDLLQASNGRLALGDKSSPEAINNIVQMSKKAFKRTIGHLYKKKQIGLSDKEIWLLSK